MEDEVSANPPGADSGPLTLDQAAERLRGLPGSDATDETSADTTAQVEGADAEVEQTEAEPTDESEPTDPPEADEQPKGRYRVKVNGEEQTVTFDELRSGYQREADYRQKTMKMAEERKALEAERTHNAELLKNVLPALQIQLQDKFANVNWTELANADPAKYVAMRAEFDQYATRLQIAQAEQQRIEAQTKAQRDTDLKERIQQERSKLVEKLPAFGDPEKGKALAGELKTFLKGQGYTDEEIGGAYDHRALMIAHDAMQYRKAQQAKAVAAKQAKTVPNVQKPGNATRVDPKHAALSAATERFGKTGKVDDLAEVLRASRQR